MRSADSIRFATPTFSALLSKNKRNRDPFYCADNVMLDVLKTADRMTQERTQNTETLAPTDKRATALPMGNIDNEAPDNSAVDTKEYISISLSDFFRLPWSTDRNEKRHSTTILARVTILLLCCTLMSLRLTQLIKRVLMMRSLFMYTHSLE